METDMPRPIAEGLAPWPDELTGRYVPRGYWDGRPLRARRVGSAGGAPEAPGGVDLGAVCAPADAAAAARARLDARAPGARDVAVFLLSGGTTGLSKLIPRTHDDYVYNATCSGELCGVDARTVTLVVLAAGHNFALACPGILRTLRA